MNSYGIASGAGRRDFLKGAAWMGAATLAAEYATMADGDFLTYGEVVRRPGAVYYLR